MTYFPEYILSDISIDFEFKAFWQLLNYYVKQNKPKYLLHQFSKRYLPELSHIYRVSWTMWYILIRTFLLSYSLEHHKHYWHYYLVRVDIVFKYSVEVVFSDIKHFQDYGTYQETKEKLNFIIYLFI